MSIFSRLNWKHRSGLAPVERNRLRVLLVHQGACRAKSDFLGPLGEEIVAVICRQVTVEPDKVQVEMDRGAAISRLAIEIEIPM